MFRVEMIAYWTKFNKPLYYVLKFNILKIICWKFIKTQVDKYIWKKPISHSRGFQKNTVSSFVSISA